MSAASAVLGLLLAGGQSRRMGGRDKCFLELGGRPILDRIIERVRPQVRRLVLNAGGDPARFAAYRLPVVADVIEGFQGPLAGILTGLEWAAANEPEIPWVASFSCDAPFVPEDLVARLAEATLGQGADMAVAVSRGRAHPVFALWPVRLRAELRQAMVDEGMRKIDRWTARYRLASVEFGADPVDPFFNINSPEDLDAAEALLAREHGMA